MANLRVDKITSTETFEKTGSVQFDGTGDYLEVSDSSDWDFGLGPFTIECWVLMHPSSVDYSGIFGMHTGSTQFQFRINNQGRIQFLQDFGGTRGNIADSDATGVNLRDSTWHHVAMVRQSDYSWQLYVDGKVNYSGTYMSGNVTGINEVAIGRRTDTNDYYLNGFISNMRVLNRAIYTENFKPPMRELEVIPGTVLLACQSKTDATLEKTGKTITANGNAVASELTPGILTPVPKAGAGSAITGSVEFNGSTDYLKLPTTTDFTFGTNDWTIEFWLNPGENSSNYTIILALTSSTNTDRFEVAYHSSTIQVYTDTGTWRDTGITPSKGDWHHIAFVRNYSGNSLIMYLNGVNRWEVTNTRDYDELFTTADIGSYASSSYGYLQGFISNFRIVNGNALYTEDFTPPTRELKKVPGTVLLCCQDPDSPLTEATGKTITGYGDLHEATDVEMLTNGSFAGGYSTEWEAKNSGSLSYANGELTVTSTQNYSGVKVKSAYLPSLVAGRKYVMTIDLKSVTNTIRFGVVSNLTVDNISTAGRHSGVFTAGAVTEVFIEKPTGSNSTFVLKSVSIRELNTPNGASNFTPKVGDDRKVTFEGVTKINSDAHFYLPTGDTASRETTGTYNAGTRGIFGGGFVGPSGSDHRDTIQFINIASKGNATDAGDLTVSRYGNAALASATRAVWAGGIIPAPTIYNTIDAVEIMSTGNAFDFGDLPTAVYYPAGFSNRTRGIYSGGASPTLQATLSYITISSKGNTQDFGDMGDARNSHSTFGSPTRGVVAGGWISPVRTNTMEYITIATTGNAKDFGDLTRAQNYAGGLSSAIRGLVGGGNAGNPSSVSNIIDYVTISAMGNAVDFGDLTSARTEIGCCSSATRGVFAGAWSPSKVNTIDYVNIQTTANAKDFGDLVNIGVMQEMGTSNGHGGLG